MARLLGVVPRLPISQDVKLGKMARLVRAFLRLIVIAPVAVRAEADQLAASLLN